MKDILIESTLDHIEQDVKEAQKISPVSSMASFIKHKEILDKVLKDIEYIRNRLQKMQK